MTKDAYDEAKSGGKHSGWLEQQRRLGESQLRGALRSFGDLIDEHRAWIANPSIKVHDFDTRPEQYKAGLVGKWNQDIARHADFISILRGVLKEKGYE